MTQKPHGWKQPETVEELREFTSGDPGELAARIRSERRPGAVEDFGDFIYRAAKGKLSSRPAFYSGRGPNMGDLNGEHLMMLFEELKAEHGETAAWQFARLVAEQQDLSASAFLMAFERFWFSGLVYGGGEQRGDDWKSLEGMGHTDAERFATGMGLIGSVLGGGRAGGGAADYVSPQIKDQFLRRLGIKGAAGGRRGRFSGWGLHGWE